MLGAEIADLVMAANARFVLSISREFRSNMGPRTWSPQMSIARLGAVALLAFALAACAHKVATLSKTDTVCRDTTFPIYFEPESDQLTPAAIAVISAMGNQLKSCATTSEVVGLAQAGGSPERSNLTLTRDRAFSVARALRDAGLPAPITEVASERGAAGGKALPLSGRAEVILHAAVR